MFFNWAAVNQMFCGQTITPKFTINYFPQDFFYIQSAYLCGYWVFHLWQTWPFTVQATVPEYSNPSVVLLQTADAEIESDVHNSHTDSGIHGPTSLLTGDKLAKHESPCPRHKSQLLSCNYILGFCVRKKSEHFLCEIACRRKWWTSLTFAEWYITGFSFILRDITPRSRTPTIWIPAIIALNSRICGTRPFKAFWSRCRDADKPQVFCSSFSQATFWVICLRGKERNAWRNREETYIKVMPCNATFLIHEWSLFLFVSPEHKGTSHPCCLKSGSVVKHQRPRSLSSGFRQ